MSTFMSRDDAISLICLINQISFSVMKNNGEWCHGLWRYIITNHVAKYWCHVCGMSLYFACVYLNILKCTMRQKLDIPRHKLSCVFSVRYFVFNFCNSVFKIFTRYYSPHVIGFCDWTTTPCHPLLGYICCAFLSHQFGKYMNVQYDAFGNLSCWIFFVIEKWLPFCYLK